MKEIVFNKKDYKSYKDFYRDIAKRTGRSEGLEDYYDITNYDFDCNCLYEDLCYGKMSHQSTNFIFKNFKYDANAKPKNMEEYNYKYIFNSFYDFIKLRTDNKLTFIDEN